MLPAPDGGGSMTTRAAQPLPPFTPNDDVLLAVAGLTTHFYTRDGVVVHEGSKRSLKFGELVNEAAKLPLPDPKTIVLRPNAKLRWVHSVLHRNG